MPKTLIFFMRPQYSLDLVFKVVWASNGSPASRLTLSQGDTHTLTELSKIAPLSHIISPKTLGFFLVTNWDINTVGERRNKDTSKSSLASKLCSSQQFPFPSWEDYVCKVRANYSRYQAPLIESCCENTVLPGI